jgi:hypothetical protein
LITISYSGLGQARTKVGHELSKQCIFGQTGHHPKDVLMSKQGNMTMTFEDKLKTITSLEELYGFANRSKMFKMEFPKWTEEERGLILARKYELMQGRK